MKKNKAYYKVEFAVNGKKNPYGLCVYADSFASAVWLSQDTIHSILGGVVSEIEILSVSIER